MISSRTYNFKLVILIVNVVSVCIAIFPKINRLDEIWQNISSILVIGVEVFLIIIGKAHENNVDKDILGKSKKEIIEELKPSKYSKIEEARAELRFGIQIMLGSAIICWIIIFFAKIIDLRWMIAGCLLMIIAYIYADYVPHSQRYAAEYDKIFIDKNEKASALRGLGRIYLEEYNKTQFCKKSKYYSDMARIVPYDYTDADPTETKTFLKCIFGNKISSTNNTLAIIGYLMLAINIITVVPDLYDFIATFFGHVESVDIKMTISICATVIFMAVSICQIYEYYDECYCVKRILQAVRSNSLAEMLSVYKDIDKGHNGSLYRIRGSFVYSQNYIEEHNTIEGCPMKYRMKFPDKYYANISRYNYTYLLSMIILFLVLSNYGKLFTTQLKIISGILICSGYIIGRYIILPKIGRRKIRYMCEKLNGSKNNSTQK